MMNSWIVGVVAALLGTELGWATPPMRARLFATGLNEPVGVYAAPGDLTHVFVTDLSGQIAVVDAATGAVSPMPFLDLHGTVQQVGDGGLLGLCFDPGYASNGYFYVFYNAAPNPPNDRVLARYHATPGAAVADAGSETVLWRYPRTIGHNGGWIGFSPVDGYLYLSTGDGGIQQAFDAENRAQTLSNLAGKMVRIDPRSGDDFPSDPLRNYRVPATNPYVGLGAGAAPEVWSLGLRNPWKCCFDASTGDLYVTSNGEDERELVYFEPAGGPGGRNYGWRCMEGTLCTGLSGCVCGSASITLPAHEYAHDVGHSIIGGVVYRGTAIPELAGKFVYADFADAKVWSLRMAAGHATEVVEHTAALALPGGGFMENISAIGEDPSGELIVADVFGGLLYRIVPYRVCPADFDGAGGVAVSDIFAFLSAWFAQSARADFDGVGGLAVTDIFAFLSAWFAGCP